MYIIIKTNIKFIELYRVTCLFNFQIDQISYMPLGLCFNWIGLNKRLLFIVK